MKLSLIASIALALALCTAAAGSRADPTFDSDVQSRLSRVKARQKLAWSKLSSADRKQRLERRQGPVSAAGDGETPCGAIDLGNVDNATVSRSAQGITVIIDGDVINANNQCR